MRTLCRPAVLVLTVLAVIVVAGPPRAARADGPAATVIELLDPAPGDPPDTVLITARLTDEQGRPLERQRVDFFVAVDFPGAERLPVGSAGAERQPLGVGSATTDATGRATIRYRPTWDGVQVVTVHSQRNSKYAAATAEMQVGISGAAVTHVDEARALAPLRDRLPLVAGGVVFLVWAVLAFVAVRTVMGIGRAGATARREAARSEALESRPEERLGARS